MAELCIVYIYTHNAKLFYLITRKFRSEGINFIALNDAVNIHEDGCVLLTTPQDIDKYPEILSFHGSILQILPEETPEQILMRTIQYSKTMQYFRKLTIAIDPGSKITGVAVFLDGVFIYSREVFNLHYLQKFLKSTIEIFPKHKTVIKIGNGVMRLTRRFVERISHFKIEENRIECEIVNESCTTKNHEKRNQKITSKHEKAAILIGRRRGVSIFFK